MKNKFSYRLSKNFSYFEIYFIFFHSIPGRGILLKTGNIDYFETFFGS